MSIFITISYLFDTPYFPREFPKGILKNTTSYMSVSQETGFVIGHIGKRLGYIKLNRHL